MVAAAAVAAPVVLAAPSHADPDTDFANQLHTFGIYGPRDYNAWIAKIACKRLNNGLDSNAYASATFVNTRRGEPPRRGATARVADWLLSPSNRTSIPRASSLCCDTENRCAPR